MKHSVVILGIRVFLIKRLSAKHAAHSPPREDNFKVNQRNDSMKALTLFLLITDTKCACTTFSLSLASLSALSGGNFCYMISIHRSEK